MNEQIISKGVYAFSQISDFISVKNYIFMHKDDKICLVIRFSNDTDYVFDSMAFSVIQLDVEGKVIGRTRVEYTGMNFEPGGMYTADRGVIVESKCVDFKIQFHEAYSGCYRYTVRNRRLLVYYDRRRAAKLNAEPEDVQARASVSVQKKEYGKVGLSALVAIIALIAMLGFNLYYMYSLYADTLPEGNEAAVFTACDYAEESLCFGVEYAEI
ncbi:MAG: hypothetical protein IJW21_07345 [Clostridia bacterium]|nr:hypothetical protein [Clostridia bacterium]